MRLVFAGTPEAAVPTLHRLAVDHEVLAAVTRPDAPRGRKRLLTPTPVSDAAVEREIPVIHAARLDEETTGRITELRPELGVIVAYGGLVREPLLRIPRHGWINLHFSLLPRWRGAAPVQRALIAGDAELGASVFRLVPELDAGDVYARRVFPQADAATADEVLTSLAASGAELVEEVVRAIEEGTARAVAQTGEPTLAAKLGQVDGLLDWTQPADAVFARYRGVTSEPGAFTTIGGGRLKILRAERSDAPEMPAGALLPAPDGVLVGTATRPLLLLRVQPAGKGAMSAADWFRGLRLEPGTEARAGL